jgi:CheY-like chemotaxis protein
MEDDKGLALLMQRKLKPFGYLVDLAVDGSEGLAMCERGSWDVLIIDHKMPGYSGLEVSNAASRSIRFDYITMWE